jgi:hypothetical protein
VHAHPGLGNGNALEHGGSFAVISAAGRRT